MREIPKIDALEIAETLPGWVYTDPAVLTLEHQRIFERTWVWFCRADQVAAPGSYVTGTVGREPVVVVRDAGGTLRALSNVCRHRGGPVALGAGSAKAFRCGYHGWTYRLDGELRHTPDFAGVECFDRADHCLPAYAVDTWTTHVFVNLSPSVPVALSEHLGALTTWAARYGLDGLEFDSRATYELACNWKTYIDNSHEGYHIPIVHPMLTREIDLKAYRQESAGMVTRQVAPIRADSADVELFRLLSPARQALVGEERTASQFVNVFPNWVVNLHPDHVVTELLEPVAVDRTRIHLDHWFPPGDRPQPRWRRAARRLIATGIIDRASTAGAAGLDPRLREIVGRVAATRAWRAFGPELVRALNLHFTHLTQLEDNRIVGPVQKGLGAPSFETGRFSVTKEDAVHHFQKLVSAHLRGEL